MRPEILFPLFAEVTSLPGIGGRTGGHLARLGITRVADLLWHCPASVVDRGFAPRLAEAPDGVIATLTVTVGRHDPAPPQSRRPYRVRCHDDSGEIDLIFFRGNRDYIREMLPEGEVRIVSGKVEHFQDRLQMSHPDHILRPHDRDRLPALEPQYPLTAGLSGRMLHKAILAALPSVPDLPEWLDPPYLAQERWPAWKEAVATVHNPQDPGDVLAGAPARMRLAYDELLANQLALALVRQRQRRRKGRVLDGDGHLRAPV
ncbi:MAG: OB-fold nucleic acid binding domain-containing protein, partial [Sphingomonadales bacterium]